MKDIILEPEYPSLTSDDIAAGPEKLLAKSRKRFYGSLVGNKNAKGPGLDEAIIVRSIGATGEYEHSSAAEIDVWLRGWRMPGIAAQKLEVQTSACVFVGVSQSWEMPSTSARLKGTPFVTITTRFIELSWRISEILPVFSMLVRSGEDEMTVNGMRRLFWEQLDPATPLSKEGSEIVKKYNEDPFFVERTTSAAVRWAIAHEMAHSVASKTERKEAYKRVSDLWSSLEEDQWEPLRGELRDFRRSIERYKDEIACDLIACSYVLDSSFAADDLLTQVSGSLVALSALIWDGYFQDNSRVSGTHPSPTLRFQLVWRAWLDILKSTTTWKKREKGGHYGLQDFAFWRAFERWGAGAYENHRDGPIWSEDIKLGLDILAEGLSLSELDDMYVRDSEQILRVQRPFK